MGKENISLPGYRRATSFRLNPEPYLKEISKHNPHLGLACAMLSSDEIKIVHDKKLKNQEEGTRG